MPCPREVPTIKSCLVAVITFAFTLAGCSATISYPTEDAGFAACETECEAKMSKFEVPELCFLTDFDRIWSYFRSVERIHETIAATRLPARSCGCLLAEISESGRYENLDVRFSNSTVALSAVAEILENSQFSGDVDRCIVGTSVPVVFGYSSEGYPDYFHTVHPTRLFAAAQELEQLAQIMLSDPVGWTYLNGSFGIVYSDYGRYLVEVECWDGKLDHSKIEFGKFSDSATLVAGESKINKCEIRHFYEIESDEQELKLKRISLAPPPDADQVSRGP